MSYSFYFKLKEHRLSVSVEAYEKYMAKNPAATLEEIEQLYHKYNEAWIANRGDEKASRLRWWALKIYNGARHVQQNKAFWY
jgi:hypothetical protein